MAIQGSVRVTPDKLISTAQQFSDKASAINSLTQRMLEIVRSTSTTWAGEASTSYLNKFNSLDQDMTRIHKMVLEHSTDLQEMAQNYKAAESENTATAGTLPSDIIS